MFGRTCGALLRVSLAAVASPGVTSGCTGGGGGDDCELSCSVTSSGSYSSNLSCGSGAQDIQRDSFDAYGNPGSYDVTYANGRAYHCSLGYDNRGDVVSIRCASKWGSCDDSATDEAGAGGEGAGGEPASGELGSSCWEDGDCAAGPATTCLLDPTNSNGQGTCTITDCTAEDCGGTDYQCCDCTTTAGLQDAFPAPLCLPSVTAGELSDIGLGCSCE